MLAGWNTISSSPRMGRRFWFIFMRYGSREKAIKTTQNPPCGSRKRNTWRKALVLVCFYALQWSPKGSEWGSREVLCLLIEQGVHMSLNSEVL